MIYVVMFLIKETNYNTEETVIVPKEAENKHWVHDLEDNEEKS